MKNTILQAGCFTMLLLSAAANAEMVVVVSAANKTQPLTAEQVSRMFLGKINTFPNGKLAIPIDQPKGDLRTRFYQNVCGKSGVQLMAYWSRMRFTGAGRPPIAAKSQDAVLQMVAENPDAVGYIDSRLRNPNVRVVYKVKDSL